MSDRERWIVYPLLFLALGVALRDKLTQIVETRTVEARFVEAQSVEVDRIRCKSIVVVGKNEKSQIDLSASSEGGLMSVWDSQQELIVALGHFKGASGLFGATTSGDLFPWNTYVNRSPNRDTLPDEANGATEGEPELDTPATDDATNVIEDE